MKKDYSTPFIFFLTLTDSLPRSFYAFDHHFKDLGFILVPVKIDQLQSLASSADQTQIIVITSILDTREMKLYREKIQGLLKFVLKSRRLTFMLLSSFSKLNDAKNFTMTRNYFFIKFPVDARLLASRICRYHDLKHETNVRWPGGRRARLGAVT